LQSYDRIHNKFCKFILGIKKCSSNFSARYELGRYPIDNFIKTQSLLYEDRLLAVDTPETLKECFFLSKSLHVKGLFSWYSYINHVRTKNKMNLKVLTLYLSVTTVPFNRKMTVTVHFDKKPSKMSFVELVSLFL
jgi:hypothetical protein